MNRWKKNINNRDVILDIISETFMSSTAFLKENDRQPLATVGFDGVGLKVFILLPNW
jgi:hypothetical protein